MIITLIAALDEDGAMRSPRRGIAVAAAGRVGAFSELLSWEVDAARAEDI